ncbi:putative transmembrane protein [Senna tora]|uniref:Putative transmembrane protein n=1 Tax=Senna tora TaxID=362788 RepID=A0A834U409_9FABA|nr:putative transmembrane protein [Senna tora]
MRSDSEVASFWNGMSKSVKLIIPQAARGSSRKMMYIYIKYSETMADYSDGSSVLLLSGWENGRNDVRFLLDEFAAEPFENSPFTLAAERTRRDDPLDGFKKYTNGWNISDHHYWASVAFTAVPVLVVAAVWFIGFGLCLLLIFLCYFCRKREALGYSRACYALSLILLILFSFAAMIGCLILYVGQGSFHHSTTTTLEYVVSQADSTVDKLRNVSDFLAQAKQVGIDRVFLPTNVQTDIDGIQTKINASASTLSDQTAHNADDIQDLLDSVRLALIIIAAVMLVLTFLGFLFSIFGMQLLVYILVIAGWILVTGTFILCGLFLLLHNVTADTCVAIDEWTHFPVEHTALDDILPCVDNATAQDTLVRSKEVTSELVNLVNQVITNVSNINFAPNFTPLYYNQSGPLMPLLCNPFHPDMTDRQCDPGEVNLANATQVYSGYVCQVSASEICMTQGRLTPTFYNQVSAGINVGNALYNYAPSLIELQDCTFVRETFSDISSHHCPALRRYSRWVYVGLVMVSTAVMLSLVFWVIYGRERRHRLHTKELTNTEPLRIPEGDK